MCYKAIILENTLDRREEIKNMKVEDVTSDNFNWIAELIKALIYFSLLFSHTSELVGNRKHFLNTLFLLLLLATSCALYLHNC
ncbi:CLUMA_CG021456, isoform A [Clunio marinus]|uniref:CLUMA_CG021456, isoform A n=1 Tax=Clunio marinus TaxID=568069 RepID=A0A1J1J827_9DIPT|nr:CLUMA_CG021456, isoform A [Clunio marinus]